MKKTNVLVCVMLLFCASCQELFVDESDTDGDETPVSPIDTIRFKDISNIFKNNCYECHSESGFSFYGLNLDSYRNTMTGSQNGPVVVPFDPEGSLLYTKCTKNFPKNSDLVTGGERMPKGDSTYFNRNPEQLALIHDWIFFGCLE